MDSYNNDTFTSLMSAINSIKTYLESEMKNLARKLETKTTNVETNLKRIQQI